MQTVTEYGEISKHIKIEKFSTYKNKDDSIFTVISVDVNNFWSEWKVIVYPMHPSQSQEMSSLQCDVFAELVCLLSSTAPSVTQTIDIIISVKGRENYSTHLHPVKNTDYPTWRGVLIPRVTFCLSKLSQNDNFEFDLTFKIGKEVFCKSEDGKAAVVKKLETILRDPQHFDICLISTTGAKFFVHSAILHCRSNILETAKVFHNQELYEALIQTNKKDDTLSSQDSLNKLSKCDTAVTTSVNGTDDLSASSSSSNSHCYQRSPFKSQTPLFTFSTMPSNNNLSEQRSHTPIGSSPWKPGLHKGLSSPHRSASPMKRASSCASPSTPKKKNGKASTTPSKGTQMQLTSFFPRSSSLKSENGGDPGEISAGFSYLSPVKAHTHFTESPSQCHRSKNTSPLVTLQSQSNSTPPHGNSGVSLSSFQTDSVIKSPFGTVQKQNFQTLRRKLFNGDHDDKKVKIIKLNMSTSVLQELICWIYTGESSRLQELCRPLLVAALRHNVEDLARSAQLHLASLLTINNASDILLLSHKYEADLLKEEAMQFSLCHASDVTNTGGWAKLSERYPQVLLTFTRRLAAIKA